MIAAATLFLASCAVKPTANFTVPTDKKLVAPATVQFTNGSMKAEAYHWDFGDGTSSEEASPKHTFKTSGNYAVVLTAKKGSKSATFKQMIQVTQPERCLIEIETEFGTMTAELFSGTPKHRDNFVKLAEEGYYNDLLFHRVINGFMIQGGDPNSRNAAPNVQLGSGGPSYTIPAEFVDSLAHIKGSICAARTSNPEKRSSGSQFYIVHGNGPVEDAMLNQIEQMRGFRYTPEQRAAYKTLGGTPHLDREYTVYGRVIQGLEIIDKIAAVKTKPGDRPEKDVKMKIRVIK